jgi:hypothetical protein
MVSTVVAYFESGNCFMDHVWSLEELVGLSKSKCGDSSSMTRYAYKEKYPAGTNVRIASLEKLRQFKQNWKYHHPISAQQMEAAGRHDRVKSVGFYHGGDVLYELERTSGTWHEVCLESE